MYVVPASIQVLHRCCFNFKFLKWNLRFLLRNNKNLLFSLLAVQKRYQKGNEPFKGNYWFRPSTKNWGTAKFLCNTSKRYRFFCTVTNVRLFFTKKIWIEVCLLQLFFFTVENPVIDCINYSMSTFIKKTVTFVSIRSQLQILISMSL